MKATESKPNKNFFSGAEGFFYALIATSAGYLTTELLTAILHALDNPVDKDRINIYVIMLSDSILSLALIKKYVRKR